MVRVSPLKNDGIVNVDFLLQIQVLNRSMDPKTYEPPQPPLIAALPPVQLPLLPQHVITSGTEKNCIRLRGLPYEAKVEHILHFLEDFAKNIVYQGVHLVYNAQVGDFRMLRVFLCLGIYSNMWSIVTNSHFLWIRIGSV